MILSGFKGGDIGLSASNTWLSKAIRFFGNMQTGKADRSHAFSMLDKTMLIEALTRVRISTIDKYKDQDIEIWRIPLSDEDREAYRIGMMQVAGDSYGWFKIPLHAADSVASAFARKPVFFFTRTFGISGFKDCSQLTVWGLHRFTKYVLRDANHDPVDWRTVSPDYLQDLLNHPHNSAQRIYSSKQ